MLCSYILRDHTFTGINNPVIKLIDFLLL